MEREPRSYHSRPVTQAFREQVKNLRNEDLPNKEISLRLEASEPKVNRAIRALLKTGQIERRKSSGRKPGPIWQDVCRHLQEIHGQSPEQPILLENCAALARKLGISRERLRQILGKIKITHPELPILAGREAQGYMRALRTKFPYRTLFEQHQQQIGRLREEGFTYQEIAARLGLTKNQVTSIVNVLILRGAISPLKKRRSPEEIQSLDQQIEDLKRRGLTVRAIAQALNLGPTRIYAVRNSLHRLSGQNSRGGSKRPLSKMRPRF